MKARQIFLSFLMAILMAGSSGFGQGQGQQQRHRHGGQGMQGQGGGGKHGQEGIEADRELFHFLLDNRSRITRNVTLLDNGIESVTESDDNAIVAKLREHVASMHRRLLEGKGVHRRDPLFAAIFDHADEIEMKIESIEKGIRVIETSANPDVVKLIRQHAETVSLFLKNGYEEVRRDHPVEGSGTTG